MGDIRHQAIASSPCSSSTLGSSRHPLYIRSSSPQQITPMASNPSVLVAQSPSIEDLLSARSRRGGLTGPGPTAATNSIYSTITSLSTREDDLDISESARLAMARESMDPSWSPSVSSSEYGHDSDSDDEEDNDNSSTQNGHVNGQQHQQQHYKATGQSPNPDYYSNATPTISESEYSRSPSLGSVRMAAVVQKAIPTSGLGISSLSHHTNINNNKHHNNPSRTSSDGHNDENNEDTPNTSPTKRVLNARNLIINTSGVLAARPYPNQSTTPTTIALPNSARIERSPPPAPSSSALLSARSVPEASSTTLNDTTNKFPHSPLRTATLPLVSTTAGAPSFTTTVATSGTSTNTRRNSLLVRRSSTDSSLSYLSSPMLDVDSDDDTLGGANKASLLRMQSFLGPKMKHISPAPWSIDPSPSGSGSGSGNGNGIMRGGSATDTSSVISSSSQPISESTSGIWSELDSEIGSVHMATKSTTRAGNNNNNNNGHNNNNNNGTGKNGKEGLSSSTNIATGTLKGLGLAIANASAAVVASASSGGSSRPSMSSERNNGGGGASKSRTTTASSAFSSWSGTSRGTTNDGGNKLGLGLSRSQSQASFDASSVPLPPLPTSSFAQQHNTNGLAKVTNITRSKSPEHIPLPPSAVGPSFPPLSRSVSPVKKADPSEPVPFSQLTTVTSAPEGSSASSSSADASNSSVTFTAASGCIQALSTSLPENGPSSLQQQAKNANAPAAAAKKAPSLPRKRPPMIHHDSTLSNTTSACTGESYTTGMTHSTSNTSLPAQGSDSSDLSAKASSPNGMKLISLQDARERERERGTQAAERRAERQAREREALLQAHAERARQAQQVHTQVQIQVDRQVQAQTVAGAAAAIPLPPAPTNAPPLPPAPAAAPKTLKSKKSGFLKLFNKKQDDHSQPPPPVPRPSMDSALPSPKMTSHGFMPGMRNVSAPGDPRKLDNVLHIGVTSPNMEQAELRTSSRADFASAVPFPHQKNAPQANQAESSNMSETTRKASGNSAPPQVSLIKPSPDLGKSQAPFTDGRPGLSVQDHRAAQTSHTTQDALAPSLSLRPVSMMLSSMPQNFLADLEKSVNKNAHLQAGQTPGGSNTASFDTLGGRASPARTPDTPSFVFFDSDNNATPPSGQTPNTPATDQFNSSPSPGSSSSAQHKKTTAFGLPTPPHSASSAMTFSGSSLPPLPTSPSTPNDPNREMAASLHYKTRIVELEQLVAGLRAELVAASKGEPVQVLLSEADGKDAANSKKACSACGCQCKTSSSVLSRPRFVGHGNMFSSGRS